MPRDVKDKKVLCQQDQIELFMAVISKIDRKVKFTTPEILEVKLADYTNSQFHEIVTWKVFNKKLKGPLTDDNRKQLSKIKVFYDFVSRVRFSEEYVWDEEDFKEIIKFSGKKELLSRTKAYKTPFKLASFDGSDIIGKLFWVYFPERYEIAEYKEPIEGISKARLEFKSLITVTLTLFNPILNDEVTYIGKYKFFTREKLSDVLVEFNSDRNLLQLVFCPRMCRPYNEKGGDFTAAETSGYVTDFINSATPCSASFNLQPQEDKMTVSKCLFISPMLKRGHVIDVMYFVGYLLGLDSFGGLSDFHKIGETIHCLYKDMAEKDASHSS